jgi:hypothetical protein
VAATEVSDEMWLARVGEACREDTPSERLCELARDPNVYVRWALATNRSAPMDALRILEGDENSIVKQVACRTLSYRGCAHTLSKKGSRNSRQAEGGE